MPICLLKALYTLVSVIILILWAHPRSVDEKSGLLYKLPGVTQLVRRGDWVQGQACLNPNLVPSLTALFSSVPLAINYIYCETTWNQKIVFLMPRQISSWSPLESDMLMLNSVFISGLSFSAVHDYMMLNLFFSFLRQNINQFSLISHLPLFPLYPLFTLIQIQKMVCDALSFKSFISI